MRTVHRIEVLAIMILFVLSSMYTLLHSPGNADAAATSGRLEEPPQINNPRPGTIFNLTESLSIQWNAVATATHYIIQWTQNKDDVNGDGDYNNKQGENQLAETQWNIEVNNADFGNGWWWFHVKAVLPADETGWSNDVDIGMDMEKPTVSINYPSPADVIRTSQVTFGGNAHDGFGMKLIEYRLDNEGDFIEGPNFPNKPAGNIEWFIPDIDFSGGYHNIEVRARDIAGRISDGSAVDFYIDVEYPTITINTPSDGEVFHDSSNIYFEGNPYDDCEVTELRYYLNGGEFGLNPESWGMNIDLIGGENRINVLVVDKAGRQTWNNITVFYDTGAPNVNIENYDTQDSGENAMADMGKGIVLVSGSGAHGNLVGFVEDESGVRWIDYKINGEKPSDAAQVETTGGNLNSNDARVDWRIPLALDEQGIYMVEVSAADRVDESSRGNVIFILDEEDPHIESISPKPDEENRMIQESETVPFSVQVMDNTGIGRVEYQSNGEGWTTLYELEPSLDQSGDNKPIQDLTHDWDHSFGWGVHTLEIRIMDLVGRTVDYSYTIIIDNEEPSVNIQQPQQDDIIDGNEVHVNVQANDNVELSHIAVFVVYRGAVNDGGSGDAGEGVSGILQHQEDISGTQAEWGQNFNLNSGKNIIYVQVTDITGRKNANSVTIWVDAGNPSVFITGPDDGQYWTSQGITVVGNAYDDSGLIDRIEVRIFTGEYSDTIGMEEGWNQANGGEDWSMDFQIAGPGENVIQARSVDRKERMSEIHEVRIHAGGDEIPGGDDDSGGDGSEGSEDEGVTGGMDPAASGGGLIVIFIAAIIILFVVLKKQKKSLAETEKELDELEGLLRVKREEKEG